MSGKLISAALRTMCALAILALGPVMPAQAAEAPAGRHDIRHEIDRVAAGAGGTVGVAAWRIGRDQDRVLVNADQHFPLASTFKVAVAGAILAKVDRGELSLDQLIAIDPKMMVDSHGLAETFRHPGVSVSIRNLLELMLTVSDNTAADVLTGLAGGPAAVTAWLREQGIADIRVDRATAGLIRDFYQLPPGPVSETFAAAVKADPHFEDRGAKPSARFDDDPRDNGTPMAMAMLLQRLFSGKALSPAGTAFLNEVMERNTTGLARIRGRLPQGTIVAEKTGTIGGTLNDVGVITLPENAGKLVVAIFIKKSDKPFDDRERAIADISRALYDYYLFEEER